MPSFSWHCVIAKCKHFVIQSRKIYQSSNRMSEMFLLAWCLAGNFSSRILGYDSGPCRFMASKILWNRSDLSFRVISAKMKHFWKCLLLENSVLLKGLKRPNTKCSKTACLLRIFSPELTCVLESTCNCFCSFSLILCHFNPIQAGVFCYYKGWGHIVPPSVSPLFVVQLLPNLAW